MDGTAGAAMAAAATDEFTEHMSSSRAALTRVGQMLVLLAAPRRAPGSFSRHAAVVRRMCEIQTGDERSPSRGPISPLFPGT
eukprot:2809911-Prymnesium_polylepis.1